MWIACLLLWAGLGGTSTRADETREPRFAGMSLAEALAALRERGLKIVFTSEVVRPEMVVELEPLASEPREVLDEILAPHGLEARPGPRDTVVVVRRLEGAVERGSTLAGSVRSALDSTPVEGARVRVVESGVEATSVADGSFRIPEHPAGTFTLETGRAGFAVGRIEGLQLVAGETTEVAVRLTPAPIVEETLTITPSRISLLRDLPGATLGLDREEILALPHLGDDFFRAVSLLPGVAANDVSAQFHVRGGRRDETEILLDGQELYEAYHLKDYDSALSFVASTTLASADLTTGGFAARFGDRMGGVLDMETLTPSGTPRGHVGVSVLTLQAGGAGGFGEGRASWLAELRRGTIDLAERLIGDEDPQYSDAYAKLEYRLDDRNTLRLNVLYSRDELGFEEVAADESKDLDTEYRSGYAWLTHRVVLGRRIFAETALSLAAIDQDRNGTEIESGVQFAIRDRRDSEVLALRQDWSFQAAPRNLVRWGFELRGFDTAYDYAGVYSFDDPLAEIRDPPGDGTTLFRDEFEEQHRSFYVSDRLRLVDTVSIEAGLRHDHHSLTDEDHLSPRFNLAWAPDRSSVLRLAWGRFLQSQRPYELQVEDGETGFHPTERSEHRVVGYERAFPSAWGGLGLVVRGELYRREVSNPRPRYDNLYEALNTFPEVEPDRVRVAPERSVAEGAELFVQGRATEKIAWWANYVYATTEDEIDGRRVPREIDQTHALNLDLDARLGRRWRLNLAWRFHTGWPTTALALEPEVDPSGGTVFVPVLGPRNGERLPNYHRLDVRASRGFRVGRGELELFVDVQNVYNQKNIAGFDIEIDEEQGTISTETEYWAGTLPSVGLDWRF